MSDTPRTDEITVVTGFLPAGEFVIPASEARAMERQMQQIERENAELKKLNAQLLAAMESLTAMCNRQRDFNDDGDGDGDGDELTLERAMAAIKAAKGGKE
jgi:hypothetical protein